LKKPHFSYRYLVIILIGILVTIFLSNKIGKPLEKFETRIYQKISGKTPQHVRYSDFGIPIVVYEGKVGEHVTVVMTAQEAIKYYDKIDYPGNRDKFFACIKWLKSNLVQLNDSSMIYYVDFDWSSYHMTKPWRSAMSQGRAMQAFLKAFALTKDPMYLDYARKTMNTLFTEVKDGGVTYKDSIGYWYEEYADDSVPPSRVLNGMIVVLQALSDYQKVTNDTNACILFIKGVSEVKSKLHLFNDNGHSNYDALGKPAYPWYHNFHIELLDFLYTETHDPIFNEYKQKWIQYKEPSYLTSLYRKPTHIGMFTVFTIFASVLSILFLSYFFSIRKK
jgi:hypothetical protein